MAEIVCSKCGLPKDLCVCEAISKEVQRIRIYTVKKRFGKLMTVVEGIDERDVDLKKLARTLKSKLACGGTSKGGAIELQGNHRQRVKELLVEQGFSRDSITD